MLAILAPGQGSQKPGFLSPWIESDPAMERRLRDWSDLIDLDLVRLGTEAGQDEITDTANTQPLLVAAGLLAAEHLLADAAAAERYTAVAGHSVGELTALAIAGVLEPEAAVRLAAVRGRAMAEACGIEPTTMAAVLGGDEDEVLAAIESAGAWPANRNGAGQIVAAGPVAAVEKLAGNPPAKARIIPLKVAGAFHTPHMAPAKEALEAAAAAIEPADPVRTLLSNRDGKPVTSGAAALQQVVAQVTSPVRWDACMSTLGELGVTAVTELPPAGTLTGLAKRALKGVERVNVNTPGDLAAAAELASIEGVE
ncbi:ACP S-malonyltransferase [Glycomyces sp. A-F 0318]|nr:ACP S-malonyltransferase [Glycomyces amatae]